MIDGQPEKHPKVSVCVVTYNQEKYIRQCLQCIVDQETDFDFEIIVGDDASSDGTTAIVREFADRYPARIRTVLHTKNIGPTQNYFSVHNLAKGDYVCHCDGDDYWLPGKLAKQARHMDSHPDCNIVWHRMLILNERRQTAIGMPQIPISQFIPREKLYAQDLAKYYGITGCHSGSMYRRAAKTIDRRDEEILDYLITLSLCINGGCAMYIDEALGVYRFFQSEKTLTKSKGNVTVAKIKLGIIHSYLKTNPELRKSFATQCAFEILMRAYLRYPLKCEYFKALLACRCLPDPADVLLIIRIFIKNRHSTLRAAFEKSEQ